MPVFTPKWTVCLCFEINLLQIMSIILIHIYQLPSLCPCIRILRIPIHFSGPAPKFMNLEKFAKYFTQPKLESYFIFVKDLQEEPIAQAKRQKITLPQEILTEVTYFLHVVSPGKDVTVCLKRLSLFLRLPYNFGIWSSEVSDWIPC